MQSGDRLAGLRDLGFEDVTAPPPLAVDAVRLDAHAVEVRAARGAMGTRVGITAIAPSADQGEAAIAEAFGELDRLSAILSRHDPASALSLLNGAGRLNGAPPELSLVTVKALELSAVTGRAFDVTVKPVLDLLDAQAPGQWPSAGELRDAAALIGAAGVTVGGSTVRFARSGMGITFDGIAKGHIVDRMAAVLRGRRVRRFLIDAGGDIRVSGLSPRRRPWSVGVRHPDGADRLAGVIALSGGAVATSGGYERRYDAAGEYHHIVSPATGRSPRAIASASVVAPDALTADALATAVVVLGPAQGLRLIEHFPRCAALVVDPNGTASWSTRWATLVPDSPEGALS